MFVTVVPTSPHPDTRQVNATQTVSQRLSEAAMRSSKEKDMKKEPALRELVPSEYHGFSDVFSKTSFVRMIVGMGKTAVFGPAGARVRVAGVQAPLRSDPRPTDRGLRVTVVPPAGLISRRRRPPPPPRCRARRPSAGPRAGARTSSGARAIAGSARTRGARACCARASTSTAAAISASTAAAMSASTSSCLERASPSCRERASLTCRE